MATKEFLEFSSSDFRFSYHLIVEICDFLFVWAVPELSVGIGIGVRYLSTFSSLQMISLDGYIYQEDMKYQ